MLLTLLFPILLMADGKINWEDPNLKMDSSKDSQLEGQIFVKPVPSPLEKLPKHPKIKDLEAQELDSKNNK
ncbi:MAG: hypothetical protein MK008_08980 [Bdellovibrionales bacterium]|nr:hypothetical protein [Bdellovibrionales bacterium]